LTQSESEDFLKDYAFAAFPTVREWLRGTDTPDRTFEIWAKALLKCERHECEAVIDAWVSGDIEPPKFLRDGFTLHVRACVMEARRKRLASKPLEDQRTHLAQGQGVMRGIEQADLWQRYWVPLKAAVDLGEMSRESALSQWKAIIETEFTKPCSWQP
jgi:hypothetical protein